MSKYELDDDMVRQATSNGVASEDRLAALDAIQDALKGQARLPIPGDIGAIVQTDNGRYFRWTYDMHSHNPWAELNNVDAQVSSEQLGRITEVLFPGLQS